MRVVTGETPKETTSQVGQDAIVERTRNDAPRTASVTSADLQAQAATDNDSTTPPAPQEIDWATVDVNTIPQDVIKGTATFKNVLSESITRRHDLKALRDSVGDTDTPPAEEDQEPGTTPAAETDKKDAPFLARFTALEKVVTDLTTLQLRAAQSQIRDGVLATAQLPAEAAAFVQGETADEMTEQAQALSQLLATSLPDPATSPGNPGIPNKDTIGARLKERMLGEGAVSVFDASLQRNKGGGAVTN